MILKPTKVCEPKITWICGSGLVNCIYCFFFKEPFLWTQLISPFNGTGVLKNPFYMISSFPLGLFCRKRDVYSYHHGWLPQRFPKDSYVAVALTIRSPKTVAHGFRGFRCANKKWVCNRFLLAVRQWPFWIPNKTYEIFQDYLEKKQVGSQPVFYMGWDYLLV